MDPEKFLTFVFSKICTNPDGIEMEVQEEEGLIRFNARVPDQDMKYVIGRKGKTINAIKTCTRIMGHK